MRRSRKSFQEITFFVGVGDGGGGYMYIWYIYKHMLYICIYYKQNSCFYLIFTDLKRNLLLIKRRQSLTPHEHCMRTTTVGGVDRQKWTAMEIKKTCIYQRGVLPRILLSLQLYDIPMSRVEAMVRLTTKFLRRWLSIPQCLSSDGLFGTGTIL